MSLNRCVEYIFPDDKNVDLMLMNEFEILQYAAKNAIAIVVYDVTSLNEEDEDLNEIAYVAVKTANEVIELDLDEEENIASLPHFDELTRVGVEKGTVKEMWESTFIPTLCQRFTTSELNECAFILIEFS